MAPIMQILWNPSCLDALLLSVHSDPPTALVNDPAYVASVRSLYQRIVREWIIVSLSHAPCTSQGLLQVIFISLFGSHPMPSNCFFQLQISFALL